MKIIFLLVFFFNLLFHYCVYASETYVVLKVNNKIITNLDVKKESRYLAALSPDLKSIDKNTLMKLAKDSIIREKIKEDELSKFFDLNEKNKFIDNIMLNYIKKMGMKNRNDFENYLIGHNLTYQDIEYKISIEAAWNDLIYNKFKNNIEIDENKIKKELKKIILNKKEQYVYHISEILFSAEDYKEITKKYDDINKSILDIGFSKTAIIHSLSDTSKVGGKIGWINETQLNNAIKKEIINIEVGDHTKPITLPGGLLILKLDDKKKMKLNINFDKELKKKIFNEKDSQLKQFSEIYFKKVYKNSTISE